MVTVKIRGLYSFKDLLLIYKSKENSQWKHPNWMCSILYYEVPALALLAFNCVSQISDPISQVFPWVDFIWDMTVMKKVHTPQEKYTYITLEQFLFTTTFHCCHISVCYTNPLQADLVPRTREKRNSRRKYLAICSDCAWLENGVYVSFRRILQNETRTPVDEGAYKIM